MASGMENNPFTDKQKIMGDTSSEFMDIGD